MQVQCPECGSTDATEIGSDKIAVLSWRCNRCYWSWYVRKGLRRTISDIVGLGLRIIASLVAVVLFAYLAVWLIHLSRSIGGKM